MKISIIFVLLLICIGYSCNLLKENVAKGCGYSTLTGTYQKHTTCGGNSFMKTIIINSKKYGVKEILVDDEDYKRASQYRWNLAYNRYTFYAIHSYWTGKGYTSVKLHRLLFSFPKGKIIDHKDGNGLNNQRGNLRIATKNENSRNSRPNKNSPTGYKGITFRKDANKWQARIVVDKKVISGGLFDNPKDAAKKYNELAILYHKDFAYLNTL